MPLARISASDDSRRAQLPERDHLGLPLMTVYFALYAISYD